VERALASWLDPAKSVVVVAGPHDADDVIETVEAIYEDCRSSAARSDAPRPPNAPNRRRRNIRVPGPYRHVLAQWHLPLLPASDAAGIDGLAFYLGEPSTGPLGRALIPEVAMGVAVRHRHHPLGADLELLMTLAPTAKTSEALSLVRRVLQTLVDAPPNAFARARAALRNRAFDQLSRVEEAAGLAASAVIDGQRLTDFVGRIEGLTQLTAENIQTITTNYLLRQKPVIIVGRPRGSK
ncbi:MAG: insulinase family protein, partial [Myxococcota bacterium]